MLLYKCNTVIKWYFCLIIYNNIIIVDTIIGTCMENAFLTLVDLIWQKCDVWTSFGYITRHGIKGPGSSVEFWAVICLKSDTICYKQKLEWPWSLLDLSNSIWCKHNGFYYYILLVGICIMYGIKRYIITSELALNVKTIYIFSYMNEMYHKWSALNVKTIHNRYIFSYMNEMILINNIK